MVTKYFHRNLRPLSRRRLVIGAAMVGGAGLACGVAPAAPAKLSQADSGYQSHPNNNQRCELCKNWLGPTSCKVVSGVISPSGWCSLYAPKA